jgi:hypothetical protein
VRALFDIVDRNASRCRGMRHRSAAAIVCGMRHNPSVRVLLPLVGMLALTHAALAQLVNENLLVTIPPGYKIDFKDRNPDRLINEMVPEDQTVGDWTEW